VVTFFALFCFLAWAQQPELIYLLRANNGTVKDIVSSPPSEGYLTKLFDLSPYESRFPKLLPTTAYDSDSNFFIMANVDPPAVGILNTYSKMFSVQELPYYGSVLAITAYDGILYCFMGANPDAPAVGHVFQIRLSDYQMHDLIRVHLPAGASYVVGCHMVFDPANRYWVVSLGEYLYKINENGPVATTITGAWTNMWSPMISGKSNMLIGYHKGSFSWIDLAAQTSKVLRNFPCNGIPSVNTDLQKIYHLQNCKIGSLMFYTVDFQNKTASSVGVDPNLASSVSGQSTGQYTPYGCGMPCSVVTDCVNSTTCNICRLGKCSSSGDCGAFCDNGSDCYSGICVGDCEAGRCGRTGCASSCRNHDDCKAQSRTCQVCRLGKCVADGECDSYCLTPLDCYGGACVDSCVNFACTKKQE